MRSPAAAFPLRLWRLLLTRLRLLTLSPIPLAALIARGIARGAFALWSAVFPLRFWRLLLARRRCAPGLLWPLLLDRRF